MRECKAAKGSTITEAAQRDVELKEEIIFRYEQLEESKAEAVTAGEQRRRADHEDQVHQLRQTYFGKCALGFNKDLRGLKKKSCHTPGGARDSGAAVQAGARGAAAGELPG